MPVDDESWKAAYDAARTFDPVIGLVHRLGLGLTRPQYAELLGTDRHAVLRWETGKAIPTPAHKKAISDLILKTHGS